MKIRLHGTEAECAEAAGRLGRVLGVLSVSEPYPDRGASVMVRVYVEARLDPLPGAIGFPDDEHAPRGGIGFPDDEHAPRGGIRGGAR